MKYRINKRFDIMSYQGGLLKSKLKQLDLKDTLIIVDEVQNIISNTGETYKLFLKEFQKLDHKKDKSKVILLSGTPMFDKAFEIALVARLCSRTKSSKRPVFRWIPKCSTTLSRLTPKPTTITSKSQTKNSFKTFCSVKSATSKGLIDARIPRRLNTT